MSQVGASTRLLLGKNMHFDSTVLLMFLMSCSPSAKETSNDA